MYPNSTKIKIDSNRKIILDKAKLNKVSILYYKKNTLNTITVLLAIKPTFRTILEYNIIEHD